MDTMKIDSIIFNLDLDLEHEVDDYLYELVANNDYPFENYQIKLKRQNCELTIYDKGKELPMRDYILRFEFNTTYCTNAEQPTIDDVVISFFLYDEIKRKG